jgi:hypothetical protein
MRKYATQTELVADKVTKPTKKAASDSKSKASTGKSKKEKVTKPVKKESALPIFLFFSDDAKLTTREGGIENHNHKGRSPTQEAPFCLLHLLQAENSRKNQTGRGGGT